MTNEEVISSIVENTTTPEVGTAWEATSNFNNFFKIHECLGVELMITDGLELMDQYLTMKSIYGVKDNKITGYQFDDEYANYLGTIVTLNAPWLINSLNTYFESNDSPSQRKKRLSGFRDIVNNIGSIWKNLSQRETVVFLNLWFRCFDQTTKKEAINQWIKTPIGSLSEFVQMYTMKHEGCVDKKNHDTKEYKQC